MAKQQKFSFLRLLRIFLALVVFISILPCFLALPGEAERPHLLFFQLVPAALLMMEAGIVITLLLITLVFGRIYCSVLCPLGILQDIITHIGGWRKGAERRFSWSPAKNAWRYGFLALFAAGAALSAFAGIGAVVALLEPYSAFGRIMTNLFAPLCAWGNNGLAALAERLGSDRFAEVEVWIRSLPTFCIALGTFAIIALLAWKNGRSYCNTVCPVGTLLGLISRHSLFGIRIDTGKCVSCGLCAKQCKASCINAAEHRVDASRCVACLNCLDNCRVGAISYGLRWGYHPSPKPNKRVDKDAAEVLKKVKHTPKPEQAEEEEKPADPERRNFLKGAGIVLATAAADRTQEKLADGGLAPIADKIPPKRRTPILPPGARGQRHFASHCTGCQLCVQACPNGVLRPSSDWSRLMQPECSYERGYCRPECTKCSSVCPTGALEWLSQAEKVSTQIGHAVWVKEHCVALTDGVRCGNCARHCPSGAITMVPLDPNDPKSPEIPVVNEERCIGCGACEQLCPARPHSAIYVEGHEEQRTI